MIKIFNPDDTVFNTNGNICINPKSCVEIKKKSLNGWYLSIEVDIKYKEYIKKDYLVVVKSKSNINPQAFRIADDDNDSSIEYTDRSIIFKANHVLFDSKNYFLVDVRPTNLNAIAALEYINKRTDEKSPFSVYSDITNVSTSYFIRKNLLEAWQVFEERYGGYFEFDNWNVKLSSSIGKDTNEIIAYGQKLKNFQIFESWSNVVTKLYPTGPNGIMLDEEYLLADVKYDVPYTKTIPFTSDLDIEEQTEENLKKELKEKALKYLNENKYPLISYEVSSDINQNLDIGDTVCIKHPLVNLKVEVLEYTYDHVSKKITSLIFGNFVRSVKNKVDSIKQSIVEQSEKLSEQEKLLINQTELINNLNKNGYVYIDDNEILILDSLPKTKAKNVWRFGLGGIAFSSNGYEGPFSTAITQDGKINADFIATGKINTSLIEGYEQLVLNVSSIEEKTEKLENDLKDANSLLQDTTANFNDFKDNEYINSISNLQSQIDGAIQFWNGPDIPTINNYPASDWKTENDKNNHRADIYTVIKDVDGEMKQGKSYRFDKVNNVWQWIELTDNELSAVQAIANEANNRSKTNANSITKLQEQDAEFKIGLDNISGRVSKTETTVEDITTTTQTSTGGNNLYLEDALESNALEYHVDGKSEQETRSGKNLLENKNKGITKTVSGVTFTGNDDGTFNISGTATANIEYTFFHDFSKIIDGETYTLSSNKTLPSGVSSRIEMYNNTTWKRAFTGSMTSTKPSTSGIANKSDSNQIRFCIAITSGTVVDIQNVGFQLEKGSTATEYEPYGASPSPDYPSEIKSIPSIRNLFDKDNYINGFLNVSTGSIDGTSSWVSSWAITDYIEINNNAFFLLFNLIKNSSSTTWNLKFGFYDKDKNFISGIAEQLSSSKSYTTPENTKYIRFNYIIANYIENVMIEEGSIAHDYVPYGAWVKVKITGKNLIDDTKLKNGYTISGSNGSVVYDSSYVNNRFASEQYIKVYEGMTLSTNYMITNYGLYDNNKTFIKRIQCYTKTITVDEGNYIRIGFADVNLSSLEGKLIVEEGSTATEYEPYQEKELLIDLNKPNLFDKDNVNIVSGYMTTSTGKIYKNDTNLDKMIYMPCKPNTIYTISKTVSSRFKACSIDEILTTSEKSVSNIVSDDSGSCITITTGVNDNYLYIFYYTKGDNEQEILDSIQIYEGYSPYYEICSIGDTKDTLNMVNRQVVIDKKVEEVILDGSGDETYLYASGNSVNGYSQFNCTVNLPVPNAENYGENVISSHFEYYKEASTNLKEKPGVRARSNNPYIVFSINSEIASTVAEFKTWLSNNPVTVKYVLKEPKQITLPNANIPLFEGVNHISLVDDLETKTSIKYYRNTPIAQDYVVQQQLDETNSNLSNTDNKVSQAQSDINDTNTNLNNNYYNKEQINVMNTSTEQMITQIKNSVETTTNATNLQISILQEQLKNGVTSVKTETGYTFDKDGLKIQKTGSEMSSQLDNDGLVVKRNETEVLTVRSSGVETENLKVRTYFTIGTNTRVENYKNGTGFFYVGGAN